MKKSKPFDPSEHTTVPEVLEYAKALEDRIALLEAALEPFAILAQAHMPGAYKYPLVEVGLPGHPPIYADDLRRAAKVMERELR